MTDSPMADLRESNGLSSHDGGFGFDACGNRNGGGGNICVSARHIFCPLGMTVSTTLHFLHLKDFEVLELLISSSG